MNSVRGFTLLEIMLVMLLLASAASLIVNIIPSGEHIHQAGKKAARILRNAQERAAQENKIHGVTFFQDGLQVWSLDKHASRGNASSAWPGYYWHTVKTDARSRFFILPESGQFALSIEAEPVALTRLHGADATEPQLLFLPGEEPDRFAVDLKADGKRYGRIAPRKGKAVYEKWHQAMSWHDAS